MKKQLTVLRRAQDLKVGQHINFFFPNARAVDRGVIYKIVIEENDIVVYVEEMFAGDKSDRGVVNLKRDDLVEAYVYTRPAPKPVCKP